MSGPRFDDARARPSRARSWGTLAALAVLAMPAARAEAGVTRVWATHDGLGIRQDGPSGPSAARNAVWDGRSVSLVGARNETLAFQVIVESDARGIDALTVSLPELKGPSGASVRYLAPDLDPSITRDRPIRVYAVHYMHVTAETHAEWVWAPGSAAAPRDTLGWKPVQLVPENARAGRCGLPVRVEPGLRQAIVIEIDTGRGRPAGRYAGAVEVRAGSATVSMPVSLEILDFALPDRATLPVMVFYEPDQPRLYQGRGLDEAYHRFAHRHKVELVHAYDADDVRAASARFDGRAFTREAGYEGPGEGVGNRIVPPSFYGPGAFASKAGWPQADAWVSFLRSAVPGAISFVYLPDEPTPERFTEVRRIADDVHANPGPGRALSTFVTRQIEPALRGAIDIWCAPPQGLDLSAAAAERQAGRQVWFYNGGRPNGPAIAIDAPPTDGRVVGWAAFKHGLDGYFYWHGVHWRHNSQKRGERVQDVWANPITFDNRGQPNKADFGYINGDGVLMYPGEDVLHPAEDRGLAGPVATLQLANLRRGLQDYEYLAIARGLGLEGVVRESLEAVVPHVFSDAGAQVGFSEDGDVFESARVRLGRAIAARPDAPGRIK
jgi:hypothetical protein